MDFLRNFLALQGALILTIGLIGGILFVKAISTGKGEVAWRVVHSGGSMAGIMLLVFVPILPLMALPTWALHAFGWSFSVGTWLLVIGMVVAAISGQRGIEKGGIRCNQIVRGFYSLGTLLSLVGSAFLVFGLLAAI